MIGSGSDYKAQITNYKNVKFESEVNKEKGDL